MLRKLKALVTSKNENALAFFNILGPIVLNGINFFTVPIFTRLLGAENFGIVSLYSTWVQVLTIVMGIQTFGTISVSRAYFREDEQPAYYSSVLSLSCLSTAAVTVLILAFIQPISAFMELDKLIVVLMLLQSFGTYVVSFITTKFTYEKKAAYNFGVSMAVALLSIVLSLVAILVIPQYSDRYLGRILGYAVPNIGVGAIAAVFLFRQGKTGYSATYWKFCLPLCLPLIFHNLSQIILAQANRVMLQQLLDDTALVGIYSFCFTFVHIINILWSALNNTWLPFYYEYVKAGDTDTIRRRSRNYMWLYTILTMGFLLLSPEVIRVFASEEFWSGTALMPVMVLSYYMVFLYSFPVNFEFYHKKTAVIAVGTCGAAAVNILLNFLLIPRYGMLGAAAATLVAYVLLFICHQCIAKFAVRQPYHYPLSFFIPGTLAVVLSAVLFYAAQDLWWVRWGVGALLGGVLAVRIYKNKSIF